MTQLEKLKNYIIEEMDFLRKYYYEQKDKKGVHTLAHLSCLEDVLRMIAKLEVEEKNQNA